MSVVSASHSRFEERAVPTAAGASGVVTLVGRALFSAIFVIASLGHFSPQTIAYAASQGVPAANLLVPASGILALVGGLSVLTGYRAKVGAWLLILFLVPVTLTFHAFWAVKDPMAAQMQMVMFLKNLSMLGAALLITQSGAGPLSFDAARAEAITSRGR